MAKEVQFIALWLADEAERDEGTNRWALTGLFNQIYLTPEATEYAVPFTVFFSAIGFRGRVECQLKLTSLSDLTIVYERPVILDAADRLEPVDMAIRVNSLPVSQPGTYAWELFQGDIPLTATRMAAVLAEGDEV